MICLVDHPGEGMAPGAVLELMRRDAAASDAVWQAELGHADFAESPEAMLHWLDGQQWVRKRRLVALDRPVDGLVEGPEGLPCVVPSTDLADAAVISSTPVNQSKTDNTHLLGEIELWVAPQWRRRGVGTAMVAALEQLARAWGATTLAGFSTCPGEPVGDLVMPAEGPFGLRREHAGTAFALQQGFTLAQGERWSVQPLDVDLASFGALSLAEGYAIQTWTGPMAPALAPDIAALTTAFEASIPMGELDMVPETYTAERILSGDERLHRSSDSVNVVARHLASGEAVARTQLSRYLTQEEAAYQGVTVVLPEHRGHGLGRSIKLAAMHEARRVWPRARRVHTWNAGENDHMWAINDSLGYRTAGMCGSWQKKLS